MNIHDTLFICVVFVARVWDKGSELGLWDEGSGLGFRVRVFGTKVYS